MRLECDHCGRSFEVPEHKVPQAERFRFTCPACHEITQVEIAGVPKPAASDSGPVEDSGLAPDLAPERIPPGVPVAMVCVNDSEVQTPVCAHLQTKRWHVMVPEDSRTGAAKLRLNRVHLVVVEDTAAGEWILQEIHRWPGRERRQVNCILIGERGESFNSLTAFIMGVNCYVHRHHPDGFESALDMAQEIFTDHQRLWTPASSAGRE